MTATTIATHPERSIDPQPHVGREAIYRVYDEEVKRGREFRVYRVPSATTQGRQYLVVWNLKLRVAYCTCKAAENGNLCWHLSAVLWWRLYDEFYRACVGLSRAELRERERDCAKQDAGLLIPTWGHRPQRQALGDYIATLDTEAA